MYHALSWLPSGRKLLIGLPIGIAGMVVLTVLLRTSANGASVGWVLVCSRASVPAPTFPKVLTTFAIEPIPVFLLLWVATGYLICFRAVRKRAGARRFSGWRAVSYLVGMALVLATVFGPLSAYDGTFLSIHMIQHFILITIAPPLILAGAPLTLFLITIGKKTRERAIYPITHSGPFHGITHPLVGVALFLIVPAAWYVTPAFRLALDNEWLHWFGYALFLFAGIHYWWPVVGANPTRWVLPHPVRVLYLFALVPIHAFLGILFYSPDRVLYPQLSEAARTWGPSPLLDQQFAGMLMMVLGELIGLIALLVAANQWANADQRQATRFDRAASRRTAPETPREIS